MDYNLEIAKQKFPNLSQDSIEAEASTFYDRGSIVRFLFGTHYREIWDKKVNFQVFKGFDSLVFYKAGGGKQTTSIEVRDDNNRGYSIRTLDKDQSRILPSWLQASALRPLLRDQTSALNPYNAMVVASLSEHLNIYHTNPELTFIPYSENSNDSINYYLAGKAVIIEEEPDSKWKNENRFDNPKDIISTVELLELLNSGNSGYTLDTLSYLKCRLFDLLLSDWDRHSHQWKWVLPNDSSSKIVEPFPIDRDMAFCQFDDGLVNTIVIGLSNNFESYRKGKSILNAARRVNELDYKFLSSVSEAQFEAVANNIQEYLPDSIIQLCFNKYPPEIYDIIGEEHTNTFKSRLEFLPEAAKLLRNNILNQ